MLATFIDGMRIGNMYISSNLTNLSTWERIAEWTGKALQWIGDRLADFFEWLRGFWPKSKHSKDAPTVGLRWIVAAVVVLIVIVLLVLALEVIRRSQSRLSRNISSAWSVAEEVWFITGAGSDIGAGTAGTALKPNPRTTDSDEEIASCESASWVRG